MKRFHLIARCSLMLFVVWAGLAAFSDTWAQMPVPSLWRGEISGQVHNAGFRLPVTVEIKPALPHEANPFHLFVGAGEPSQVGHVFLSSAMQFGTSRGPATLQYLAVSMQGARLTANLTSDHRAEAAKANGFCGPNVSAEQASDLMKGVLRDAWGATEMFGFTVGARLTADLNANQLAGAIEGSGGSYTATSSAVPYRARFSATRVR